jgi:hypothetical protein
MKTCDRCKEWIISVGECECVKFTITDEDGEFHTIWQRDMEDAALKYAEVSNENHENYLFDGPVIIKVDGIEFEIFAEPDIHYHVKWCKPLDEV